MPIAPPKAPTNTPARLTPRVLAERLEPILAGLTARYDTCLRLLDRQSACLRKADAAGVAACSAEQALVLEEINELDKRRRELVALATSAYPQVAAAQRGRGVTITQLTEVLEDPDRTRLSAMAERLKGIAVEVKDRSAVIRSATASLLTHVEGLVRQVSKRLSHAGTYGPRGVVETGGVVVSGIDMRT